MRIKNAEFDAKSESIEKDAKNHIKSHQRKRDGEMDFYCCVK
jgi:hypothetical protein